MDKLRISLTVAPVGPRGATVLNAGDELWFAVQATAGFEESVDIGRLGELWPWHLLLDGDTERVELKAWRADTTGGSTTFHPITVTAETVLSPETETFGPKLRKRMEEDVYGTPHAALDLRLLFPEELRAMAEEERHRALRWNFPTRLNYLSSLPGELTRCLAATTYLKVQRDDLFDPDGVDDDGNRKWKLKSKKSRLWVSPFQVFRPAGATELAGTPSELGEDRLKQGYDDGLTDAFGPGYDLARYLDADSSPLFDLSRHWFDVDEGDARFTDLEQLLVSVLEPLSEARQIDPAMLVDRVKDAREDELGADALDAVRKLWLAAALEGLLTWSADGQAVVPRALSSLAAELIGERVAGPLYNAVEDEWKATWTSRLHAVTSIAKRLRVLEADPGQTLRRVAERAELDTVQDWIQDAFESALRGAEAAPDADAAPLRRLREAWDALDTDPSRRRERRAALVQAALQDALVETYAADALASLADGGLTKDGDAVAWLRKACSDALLERWRLRKGTDFGAALKELGMRGDFSDALILEGELAKELSNAHLDTMWTKEPRERENAARPLTLVLGRRTGDDGSARAIGHSVVHERNPNIVDAAFEEVTGHSLLVRRHDKPDMLDAQPWRLISGGVALLDRATGPFAAKDADEAWCRAPLVVAEENSFVNGILRNDRPYDGRLRHAQSPLDIAYAESGGAAGDELEDTEEPLLTAYSYQGLRGYDGTDENVLAAADTIKAPLLRFGDTYEFAAALVDSAGGLPSELAEAQPWRVAPTKVKSASPPSVTRLAYRRRQPIGGVSILPNDTARLDWPKTPKGVALRVREWRDALASGSEERRDPRDDIPEILLSDGPEFRGDTIINAYRARLEPPSVDEFTLRRWAAPAPSTKGSVEYTDAQNKLRAALVNVHVQRSGDETSSLHDPAVTHLGIRVQVFDVLGREVVSISQARKLVDENSTERPFQREALVIDLLVRNGANADSVRSDLVTSAKTNEVPLHLPPGWFGRVEAWALVREKDFQERFAEARVFHDLLEETLPDELSGFIAFQSNELLFEVATAELPSPAELHRRLTLEDVSGDVVVSFAGANNIEEDGPLQQVARYTLARERWRWRNRPVLAPLPESGVDDTERRRLAASGLPELAFVPPDPGSPELPNRDNGEDVRDWEDKARFDRGFVDRGAVERSWPRRGSAGPGDAGGVASQVELLLDTREGVQAADYLRYGLTVYSRYAPILHQGSQAAEGTAPYDDLRRIAVPYRGVARQDTAPSEPDEGAAPALQHPLPPKILSVVPLTRAIASDPLGATGATPFLVLVDESWFREYGIGERLEAWLSLENADIGEDPSKERLYRVGAEPTHFRANKDIGDHYPQDESGKARTNTDEGDRESPVRLDLFGPFGYSLDVSPDEALANATAFVLHPPKEIGPRWAAYVRFRRVVDVPGDTPSEPAARVSEPSDTYALYTLAGGETLAVSSGAKLGELLLTPDDGHPDARQYSVALADLRWDLNPLSGSPEDIPGVEISAEDSKKNYRYFVLVSEQVRDASRDLTLERPTGLLRIREEAGVSGSVRFAERLAEDDGLSSDVTYTGRLLEVRVNGIYPDGVSRLDRRDGVDFTFKEFWDRVLERSVDEQLGDAAGDVRRMSDPFIVRVSKTNTG